MDVFFFGVILLLRWAMNRAGVGQEEWIYGYNPSSHKIGWYPKSYWNNSLSDLGKWIGERLSKK